MVAQEVLDLLVKVRVLVGQPMKMKDRERDVVTGSPCERPVALMLTYERPGSLLATVGSYWKTCDVPLYVFDDGSQDPQKQGELRLVEAAGAHVMRMKHKGFARSWLEILRYARKNLTYFDSLVLLEDDLMFADGWLETLQAMQRGITAHGLKQGMVSCLMPHDKPQGALMSLSGVEAYQSFGHTFQVNMMPWEVLKRFEVIQESVDEVLATRSGHGLDIYLVGNLAHRLKRMSFVSTSSWVAHVGIDSIVESQGFGSCRHCGNNLVPELERIGDIWKNNWKNGQSYPS